MPCLIINDMKQREEITAKSAKQQIFTQITLLKYKERMLPAHCIISACKIAIDP